MHYLGVIIQNNKKNLKRLLHFVKNCDSLVFRRYPMKKTIYNNIKDLSASRLYDEYRDFRLAYNRQAKLLKEADVLLKTFWHLVSSSQKYVIFKDFYCNHSFLSSAEFLHTRIKRELYGSKKKKGGV